MIYIVDYPERKTLDALDFFSHVSAPEKNTQKWLEKVFFTLDFCVEFTLFCKRYFDKLTYSIFDGAFLGKCIRILSNYVEVNQPGSSTVNFILATEPLD